jgi:hypothetical protein
VMRLATRGGNSDTAGRCLAATSTPSTDASDRIGHGRALGADKHSMLCACWHMVTTGELYHDRQRLPRPPQPRTTNSAPRRPARTPRPQGRPRAAPGGRLSQPSP